MPLRTLTKELQEKAKIELNEVPDRIEDDLDHIKGWLSKQPHIQIEPDDQLLVSFLRTCKYSLQQVKDKLDVYYRMRTVLPEFFSNRNPHHPDIQEFFGRSIFAVLPQTAYRLEPRRFLIRSRNCGKVSVTIIIKSILMVIDILTVEDDEYIINGQEVIVDLQDVSYAYVAQLTPRVLKALVLLIQSAYATRFKGIYFINVPSFFQAIINIFKTFLSQKIKNRLRVYSEDTIQDLYKLVDVSCFPEEYGGNAGTMKQLSDSLKLKVENHQKWFEEDSKNHSDESKRPSNLSNEIIEDLSMEGSFRKLNID